MVILLVGPALALAGCATRVPQVLSPQIVPKTFVSQSAETTPIWPRADWWKAFGSPELSHLIEAAQAGNRDLAAGAARILEAKAQTFIARSALFPELSFQGQAERFGTGATGTGPATVSGGTRAGSPSSVAGSSSTIFTGHSFSVGMGASYSLDVWGLARANLRAAEEALNSTRFAQQALALSITANVADGYFSLLALRERIAIANKDIAAIKEILDVIELRVSTGTSSHLDLAREQAQVESVEAELPVLEEGELEARVALAVLLGRPPEALEVKAQDADGIRLPAVAPGIPSELLLRRPDVADAEANLASAHANLDAARAAFLPQFSLTGSAGFASTAVNALLHGPSFLWGAGANLLQAIFDGTLIGHSNLASARQKELVADYENAVFNAYGDVEKALSEVRNTAEAENHLQREVSAAREAFEIAQLQYRQGAAELLNVLQAQQTLFGAQDQLAQTQLTRREAVVHLFEALGGGWSEPPKYRTQFPSAASTVDSKAGARPFVHTGGESFANIGVSESAQELYRADKRAARDDGLRAIELVRKASMPRLPLHPAAAEPRDNVIRQGRH